MSNAPNVEWNGRTRGNALGYSIFTWFIRHCDVRVAYGVLVVVVIYFTLFAFRPARHSYNFARRRLGYNLFQALYYVPCNFFAMGQKLIDKIAISSGKKDQFTFKFDDHYDDFVNILNRNTGVVILGAHVGNWEIGTPFFGKYAKRINIVMLDAEKERVKAILEREARHPDYQIIGVEQGGIRHVFQIAEAIQRSEYVCLQGDRYMNSDKTLRLPFMGSEAEFPEGPFLLATQLNVPVVFYFAMREPHRTYRFVFTVAEQGNGRSVSKTIAAHYAVILEHIVRRYPTQWFNFYDFWGKNEVQTTKT